MLKNFDNIPMMNLMKHDIIIIVPHHTFLPQDGKKIYFYVDGATASDWKQENGI